MIEENTKKKTVHPAYDATNERSFVSQKLLLFDPETKKYLIGFVDTSERSSDLADLPGGRLNKDETLNDGFLREVEEEVGVSVMFDQKARLLFARSFFHEGLEEHFVFNYILGYYQGGEVTKSEEHESFEWLSAQEISEHEQCPDWMSDLVQEAEQRIQEMEAHENMLRVLAEFDNYKKRAAEEKKEFTQYASEKVIMDMLPVLDNFHAATAHIPEDQADSPWLTGIMYIQKQMEKVFEDAGVSEITVSAGDAFDAAIMEASEGQGDQISKVVQKGYKIGDRIIRAARVEVTS